MTSINGDYPWVQAPLISVAPMRLITLSKLAAAVSNAGGLGFIGGGSDTSELADELEQARSLLTVQGKDDLLPIGVGYLLWAGDKLLDGSLPVLKKYRPSAVWLFAPSDKDQYARWSAKIREASPGTKIWIQIGTVAEAKEVLPCKPDVLVIQGIDAGGHGLAQGASFIASLPEIADLISKTDAGSAPRLIAAGGIMDGRGVAAALALGAEGVCLGTRYLATSEAVLKSGYQEAVLNASDGGINTARGNLYDTLRGTTDWPVQYDGRGLLNQSWYDAGKGMDLGENKRLYAEALKKGGAEFGPQGRLTAYAGTGVGLVSSVSSAETVTKEIRQAAVQILQKTSRQYSS